MPSPSGRRLPGHNGPPSTQSPPATRDWAALPDDVQLAIFSRLRQVDILRGAGLTCRSWRRITVDEPMLWRRIDISNGGWASDRMIRAAVNRSAGRCESYRGPVGYDFLVYLADSAPALRSLHVTSYFVDLPWKECVIPKLPVLERVVLPYGEVRPATMRALLDHCPRLEQLDAGGCYMYGKMCSELRARLERTVKALRLPRSRFYYLISRS